MKTLVPRMLAVFVAVTLAACATDPASLAEAAKNREAREARQDAYCKRTGHCGSYNPQGKTEAENMQALRDVRAVVEAGNAPPLVGEN